MKNAIKTAIAGIVLGLVCVQPSYAMGFGFAGPVVGDGNEVVEKSSPQYTCWKKMAALYRDLSVVHSVTIGKDDHYYATPDEANAATEASYRLGQEYKEAKQACDAKFIPAYIVSDFLRGFNFTTGEVRK